MTEAVGQYILFIYIVDQNADLSTWSMVLDFFSFLNMNNPILKQKYSRISKIKDIKSQNNNKSACTLTDSCNMQG